MAHAGMLGRLGRVHFGQSDHSADGTHLEDLLVTLVSRIAPMNTPLRIGKVWIEAVS